MHFSDKMRSRLAVFLCNILSLSVMIITMYLASGTEGPWLHVILVSGALVVTSIQMLFIYSARLNKRLSSLTQLTHAQRAEVRAFQRELNSLTSPPQ